MPWDFALIFFFLAVVLPWKGYTRMRKLLALPQISSLDRLSLYAGTMALQWLATTVVAWRALARGMTAAQLALAGPIGPAEILASLVGGAALFTLQWLNLRRISRLPAESRGFLQRLAAKIFPHSGQERVVYVALAITAGLCEEFLYRGFAFAALQKWGSPVILTILASSILFGLGHIYQGRSGFLGTTLVGIIFATGRIAYDSLLPVIAWHWAIDLAAGLAGSRFLIEKKERSGVSS